MSKHVIETSDAPSSPFYSQGIRAGASIYVSGMTGTNVVTQQLAGTTIGAQTRQALDNCLAIIGAGGGTIDDIVSVTVLLANPADFAGMNNEYVKVFAERPPARAVAKLGVELPDVLVSIAMIAEVDA